MPPPRVVVLALFFLTPATLSAKNLDIYFIDVEGGQSTLVVTPAGQTLLIDTGFPGVGGFAELKDITWVDLPTSHWPMWSRPKELAEIIGKVASG